MAVRSWHASIVQAPSTQANSQARESLNQGQAAEGWSQKKPCHSDRDSRWTKKHGKAFYGYKLHASTDRRYKLIRRIKVAPANVFAGLQQLGCKVVRAMTLARNERAILVKCAVYTPSGAISRHGVRDEGEVRLQRVEAGVRGHGQGRCGQESSKKPLQ